MIQFKVTRHGAGGVLSLDDEHIRLEVGSDREDFDLSDLRLEFPTPFSVRLRSGSAEAIDLGFTGTAKQHEFRASLPEQRVAIDEAPATTEGDDCQFAPVGSDVGTFDVTRNGAAGVLSIGDGHLSLEIGEERERWALADLRLRFPTPFSVRLHLPGGQHVDLGFAGTSKQHTFRSMLLPLDVKEKSSGFSPARQTAPDAAPDGSTSRPLDIESLRHYTEPSRFALAAVSVSLMLSWLVFGSLAALGLAQIALAVGIVGFFVAAVWLLLQLRRVQMLGGSVRVTAASLPELNEAIEEVRARLDYRGRVDVYVVDKLQPAVQLTSFFSVRVLLLDGSAVAGLTSGPKRPQLVFMLATYFGALRARHTRWTVALVTFGFLGVLRFLNPFLNPWYRSTVYTGDQIAFACCDDLAVSIRAINRFLVGDEMVDQLRPGGLIAQAAVVRRSLVLRNAEWQLSAPHLTNRYLNILSFAAAHSPSQFAQYRADLDPASNAALTSALLRFRQRQAAPIAATLGMAFGCFVLAISLVGGLLAHGD